MGSGNLAPSGSGNETEAEAAAVGVAAGSPSSDVERSGTDRSRGSTGRSGGVSAVVEVEYERFEGVFFSTENALSRPSEEQSRSCLQCQFQRVQPHTRMQLDISPTSVAAARISGLVTPAVAVCSNPSMGTPGPVE